MEFQVNLNLTADNRLMGVLERIAGMLNPATVSNDVAFALVEDMPKSPNPKDSAKPEIIEAEAEKEKKPAKRVSRAKKAEAETEKETSPTSTVTEKTDVPDIMELRAIVAKKLQNGFRDEVVALLSSFGEKSVTDLVKNAVPAKVADFYSKLLSTQ